MKAIAGFLCMGLVALLGLFSNAAANSLENNLPAWVNTPFFLPLVGGKLAATSTQMPTTASTLIPTPSLTIDPSQFPDLEPLNYGFHYKFPCPWDSPGEGWASVLNSGEVDAGPFTVYLDISEGGTVIPVPGLESKATVVVRMALQHGPPGMVEIVADYDRDVVESNESNNFMMWMFTPPPSCTPTGTISP